MLIDIVEARAAAHGELWLRFEDGATGVVNVAELVRFEGVLAPLAAPDEFAAVRVDPEMGTVVWPCGADLEPDVLYATVTGTEVVVAM